MGMETHLTEVEDGYARVLNENDRSIGTVSRDKAGSGRTSFLWYAYRGRTLVGSAYTRAAAVALLVARVEEEAAKAAAFRARYSA